MAEYRITLVIELTAESPEEAARTFLDWNRDQPGYYLDIEDTKTKERCAIDTEEWLQERE
jgi:hypothetical protein